MEARRRFLRRRGDVVAPQAGSYLSLPRPFPPPSWCGARRPGDTQHEPCGTRAGPGGRRKPLDARWPPDPRPHQNRDPRSLGLGESFINKAPEPALGLIATVKDVACIVYFFIHLFNCLFYSAFFPRRLRCTPDPGADLSASARYTVSPRKASAHPNPTRARPCGSLASPSPERSHFATQGTGAKTDVGRVQEEAKPFPGIAGRENLM